jgi:hypothetical protein
MQEYIQVEYVPDTNIDPEWESPYTHMKELVAEYVRVYGLGHISAVHELRNDLEMYLKGLRNE